MPHHLYHTEGLILAQRPYGEANLLYQIFSPDLGLVAAVAQGARYARSKLRPHLRELSHARLTLVRGRELWRLTAAVQTNNLAELLKNQEGHRLWARVAGLTLRLIRGEDRQPELYHDLIAGLIALGKQDNDKTLATCEQLLVLRLLAHLGYVAPDQASGEWLRSDLWQNDDVNVVEDTTRLLELINHGIAHSQL